MSNTQNAIQDIIACAKESDINGRMGAGGASGALVGVYASGASPIGLLTITGFTALGMVAGSLPTLGQCAVDVLTDKYPAPVPNVAEPKSPTPAR